MLMVHHYTVEVKSQANSGRSIFNPYSSPSSASLSQADGRSTTSYWAHAARVTRERAAKRSARLAAGARDRPTADDS